DEIVHLTAGHAYWEAGDFRLHPENGNLPQRWAALPLVTFGYKFPSHDHTGWQISDAWSVGDTYFYDSGNDLYWLLLLGRSMIAIVGVALGALVFVWSKKLFGLVGAYISLSLYVVSPTILAHGSLATSDMTVAFFFTASLGS